MRGAISFLAALLVGLCSATAVASPTRGPTRGTVGSVGMTAGGTFEGPVAWCTISQTADDATPSVGVVGGCAANTGGNILETSAANSGPLAVTDLDSPLVGQVIYIVGMGGASPTTIAHGGNFSLEGGNDWTGDLDHVLALNVEADNDYREVGRTNGDRWFDAGVTIAGNLTMTTAGLITATGDAVELGTVCTGGGAGAVCAGGALHAESTLDVTSLATLSGGALLGGNLTTTTAGGPAIVNGAASGTGPVFTFDDDLDNGVGSFGPNQLSFIGGGIENARLSYAATYGSIFNLLDTTVATSAIVDYRLGVNATLNDGAGGGMYNLIIGNLVETDAGAWRTGGVNFLTFTLGGVPQLSFLDDGTIYVPAPTTDIAPLSSLMHSAHSYTQGSQTSSDLTLGGGIGDGYVFESTDFANGGDDSIGITVDGTLTTIVEGVGGAPWICDATSDIVCACSLYDYLIAVPVPGVVAQRTDGTCSDAKVFIQPTPSTSSLDLTVTDAGGGGIWGTRTLGTDGVVQVAGSLTLGQGNTICFDGSTCNDRIQSNGGTVAAYAANTLAMNMTAGYAYPQELFRMRDNKSLGLGGNGVAASDITLIYNSAATDFTLSNLTGLVLTIDDGQTGVVFAGDVTVGTVVLSDESSGNLQITANALDIAEHVKDLAAGSADVFATVAVGTEMHEGGMLQYSLHADDGTDFQIRSGTIPFAAVNKAGTITCDIGNIPANFAAIVNSAGTSALTLACADAGSNIMNLTANATSTLTETTLELHWAIYLDEAAVVAPQ